MVSTANITTVRDEDRDFIKKVSKLTVMQKAVVQGIVIGLQLKENEEREENEHGKNR